MPNGDGCMQIDLAMVVGHLHFFEIGEDLYLRPMNRALLGEVVATMIISWCGVVTGRPDEGNRMLCADSINNPRLGLCFYRQRHVYGHLVSSKSAL